MIRVWRLVHGLPFTARAVTTVTVSRWSREWTFAALIPSRAPMAATDLPVATSARMRRSVPVESTRAWSGFVSSVGAKARAGRRQAMARVPIPAALRASTCYNLVLETTQMVL
jgi:hypothetical protein